MKSNSGIVDKEISQLGNVDQIREIIFGSQAREVKTQFEKLENSMKLMQEDFRRKLEQQERDNTSKISNEVDVLTRKIKNIVTQQQEEFDDIKDNALKQQKRIQNLLDVLEDELNNKNDLLQKQLEENRQEQRSQRELLKEELLESLNTQVSELEEVKLSRDDAADIMMEAAMQLKGGKLDQQLSISQLQAE